MVGRRLSTSRAPLPAAYNFILLLAAACTDPAPTHTTASPKALLPAVCCYLLEMTVPRGT